MQLLEKHNYEFKAKLEVKEKLHSLKCDLLEHDSEPYVSYFRIKPEHKIPLFNNDCFKADIENNKLSIYLEYDECVYFEAAYEIDLNTGEVSVFFA